LRTNAKTLSLILMLACVPIPVAVAGQVGTSGVVTGQAGLRWDGLTHSNSAALDYQDLSAYLRLSTAESGPYGLRFHLNARGRKGLDEHLQSKDNAFESRVRVQQAYLETKTPGRLHWFVGRHYAPLQGVGARALDGVSVQRSGYSWSAKMSGGLQTAFWRPNAPVGSAGSQWGAEVEWRPPALPWRLGVGFIRNRDSQGRDRSLIGVRGTWKITPVLSPDLRIEVEPQNSRIWATRLQNSYRTRRFNLLVAYAQRLVTPYPVFMPGDTGLHAGKVHAFDVAISRRWDRTASARLNLRRTFGVRELSSTRLQLAWHRLPLVPVRFSPWRLTLTARDSWSRWRRLEQAELSVSGNGVRRLHFSLGVQQSLFKWNTSRRPQWRGRTRPHIRLRYSGRAGWSGQLKIEETIDEFEHLRTRVAVGISHRL
jgi:hypothetical protein